MGERHDGRRFASYILSHLRSFARLYGCGSEAARDLSSLLRGGATPAPDQAQDTEGETYRDHEVEEQMLNELNAELSRVTEDKRSHDVVRMQSVPEIVGLRCFS